MVSDLIQVNLDLMQSNYYASARFEMNCYEQIKFIFEILFRHFSM